MLDDLFGRGELRDRIDALAEERDRLQAQLEAEAERRKAAVRDRQSAEEELNRLEDHVASLEGRLERVNDERDRPTFDRVTVLSLEETEAQLEVLRSVRTTDEGAVTAVVHEEVPDDLKDPFGERWPAIRDAMPCVVVADAAGVIRGVFEPPIMPPPDLSWDDRFALERQWFLPTGRHTFVLVRADVFAVASYDGIEQLQLEGFESEVMGRHSKGGFSQARFERRREEQIEAHLDRCRDALSAFDLDRTIVVGDGRMIGRLGIDAVETAAVDASGTPAEALGGAVHEFWRTRLYRP